MKHNTWVWMTVVGSIAVAALVAPASIRYFKNRQVRGIQSAAGADLDLIFDAEQAFFEKHGFYTSDLRALGLAPKHVLYKVGFVRPAAFRVPPAAKPGASEALKDLDPEIKDMDRLKQARPNVPMNFSPVTKLDEIDFNRVMSFCADCVVEPTAFKAVAVANLDDDPVLDVWTVDEKRNVRHVIDDLAE